MTCTRSATRPSPHDRAARSAVGTLLLLLAGVAASAEEPRATRTDFHGDPLPPGAVARLGTARLRHPSADALTFSRDGKRLISASHGDGAVRIWDASTGKLIEPRQLGKKPEGRGPLWAIALAPGGEMAASQYDSGVHLFDTATGKETGRLALHSSAVGGAVLSFSPDGKFLLAGWFGGKIQLWDVVQRKTCRVLKASGESRYDDPWSMAISPDGKRLAAVFRPVAGFEELEGEVHVWDTTTGREVTTKDGERPGGEAVAFSPDGKTLAMGGGKPPAVRLLDAATLKETANYPTKGRTSRGLAFSPDGRFLAEVYGWSRDHRSERSGVFLWDLKGAKEPRRLPGIDVRHRFAFSPDSKMLACPSNWRGSDILVWDTASGRRLLDRPGHASSVQALAVSPDGKLVASAADTVYLWKAATGEPLHELGACSDGNHVCLFSRDGKQLLSTGPQGTLRVSDVATGKVLRRFQFNGARDDEAGVQAAGISGDGKRMAAVFKAGRTSGQLLAWDLATGKELGQRPYKLEVRRVEDKWGSSYELGEAHAAFSPDGEVVTMWRETKVGLEEVSTGRRLATLPEGVGQPLLFSPDGQLVAAAHTSFPHVPTRVSLIETATGKEILRLETGECPFWNLRFTPDSRTFVLAQRKALRVWDADTGEQLHEMAWPLSIQDVHGDVWVSALAMLPNGRAVTGMNDGEILVWDLPPASWTRGKPARDFSRKELDALWSDLAADARKAHRALHTLTTAPDRTLQLLRDRLKPATAVDAKRVEKLLAELDDRKFAAREAAVRELTDLRDQIEPMLQQALKGQPTLETRRRLQALLAEPCLPSTETRRALRAVVALERIGSTEARQVLEKLSAGVDARETRAANAALERLKGR